MGVFLKQLIDWAEKPCALTICVGATGNRIRIAGILRSYFSLSSLHGWALVPPLQHGGFESTTLTELDFGAFKERDVLFDGSGRCLRFSNRDDVVFELEREAALFTPPPRHVREGRYLYVGGRRRRGAEPWMLQ